MFSPTGPPQRRPARVAAHAFAAAVAKESLGSAPAPPDDLWPEREPLVSSLYRVGLAFHAVEEGRLRPLVRLVKLAQQGLQPAAHLVVLAVEGDEFGLVGSELAVDDLKRQRLRHSHN